MTVQTPSTVSTPPSNEDRHRPRIVIAVAIAMTVLGANAETTVAVLPISCLSLVRVSWIEWTRRRCPAQK